MKNGQYDGQSISYINLYLHQWSTIQFTPCHCVSPTPEGAQTLLLLVSLFGVFSSD